MPKYIARFTPQAWIRDLACEVDCEGDREWDVTEELSAMSESERNAAMIADTYESDDLRGSKNAPDWVKNWSGPFYVSVEERQ